MAEKMVMVLHEGDHILGVYGSKRKVAQAAIDHIKNKGHATNIGYTSLLKRLRDCYKHIQIYAAGSQNIAVRVTTIAMK